MTQFLLQLLSVQIQFAQVDSMQIETGDSMQMKV